MPNQFANFATPLLTGGAGGVGTALGATDMTVHVTTGAGAYFPTVYPYQMPIGNPAAGYSGCEIVKVTASAGSDAFTIVRAQEGTAAQSWPVGTTLMAGATALQVNALNHTYNIRLFGGKMDGATDDTAALNAAIAAVATAGGGIVDLGPGVCLISSTIVIGNGSTSGYGTQNGIAVRGDGMWATSIKWNGASAGTACQIQGPIYGCSFSDLTIDGNSGLCGIGLLMMGGQFAHFPSLRVIDTTSACIKMTTASSGTQQANQGNNFGQVLLRTAAGTNVAQSYGLQLTGVGANDTTWNSFGSVHIWAQTNYSTGLQLGLCDWNTFAKCAIYGYNLATQQRGMEINGTITAGFPNGNWFGVLAPEFNIVTSGTPGSNMVANFDSDDSSFIPSYGSGLSGLAVPLAGFSAEVPLQMFGQGAPLNMQTAITNQQITTTGANNLIQDPYPLDGFYLGHLYLRVTGGANVTVTAAWYSTDETGVVNYAPVALKSGSAGAGTVLNGASLTPGSYSCESIPFRWVNGGSQLPVLYFQVGTANVVYVTASISKVA